MLSPYRVLDLTDERGHFTGAIFAALGADVIAIEPPGGSPARRRGPFVDGFEDGGEGSLTHLTFNRAKRSVVLDLDTEAGREQLRDLVRGADVLLETAAPGWLEARDLGRDALAALNPALVHVSITPFGSDGPKAGWAATDLTVMAASSPLALMGDADRAPVRMSVPQAFSFASAAAAGAALIALQERAVSGRGQHVDVSAQQVTALATQGAILAAGIDAPVPTRGAGGATVGKMKLRFVYPSADGGYVSITHVFGGVVGPVTARLMEWVHEAGFCDEAMRDKDWVAYPVLVDEGLESLEGWEEVKAAVEAFTRSMTKAELLAGAVQRRLVLAPVADLGEVLANPHFAFRATFDEVEHPASGQCIRVPGAFARFSVTPTAALGPPPRLGQHTDEVLAEPPRRPAVEPAGARPEAAPEGSGALAGLKVLDLSWSVAGPVMTRVLADHGATVIKVESVRKLDAARGFMPLPQGKAGIEDSGLFDDVNAGKRSASIKISEPEGLEVLKDLVRWADVVVSSFSPRALPAMGIDDASLRAVNPQIITLATSLMGQTGPLADFAGYGNLAAALCGFYEVVGWPDRPPAGPYLAYTDYTSNHLMLVAVLAALDHRRRTGEGQAIDLSQAEASLHYLAPQLAEVTANGRVPSRVGNADAHLCPHGVFPTAGDDTWVAVVAQDDVAWLALCGAMGRPDLAADPDLATVAGRQARRDELEAAVAAWTTDLTGFEVEERCQAVGVAAHAVLTSPGCLADPQFAARGHFVDLEHPHRRCLVEATRFQLSRTPGAPQGRAPFLGEHTLEVLTDVLGYDLDKVADLAIAEVLE